MIRTQLAAAIASALDALGLEHDADIHLEPTRQREHGDWATNIALTMARAAGRNPRELATDIKSRLDADLPPHVTQIDIAGPGFINFHLAPTWLHDVLTDVVESGQDGYARPVVADAARNRVNLEFVSANPTGPLHAGGGRWAAYGDALANILERCGYVVTREYYLNDRGAQMDKFAASLVAAQNEQPMPEDGYAGAYIAEWAAEMPAGLTEEEARAWGYERVKRDLAATLHSIGVEFDVWFSEQSLVDNGAIESTLADLREHGYVFDADGAVWLKSTEFGDDQDRVLIRSDGEPTYVLPDIAYHRDKFARGHDLLIDVWGADHHGYVARLKAGVQALGHGADELEIVLGQLVKLERDGEEVRLSKRAGTLVLLEDLLDSVGPDVARLTFLLQSLDTTQTIDLGLITRQSNENPVFYVQYAHARIHSMGRFAAEKGIERQPLGATDLGLLVHERELEVLRTLSGLPAVVELACRDRAPHKCTTWVRELADRFHGFYHDCYVIGDGVSPELTQARLWLVEASRIGFAIGLGLLGVSAPESM